MLPLTAPMLKGRRAQCPHCKTTRASIEHIDRHSLAFFEYRGPLHAQVVGGTKSCDECGYARCVHALDATEHRDGTPWNPVANRPCAVTDHRFTDAEGRPFDRFYCGCRGWD